MDQLKAFDNCIRDFLWSSHDTGKQPRVDWETIKKSLVEGGLSLISILEHTYAMVAKFMLWIIQDGDHTL